MSSSSSRRYPSVAAESLVHPEYKATVTNAGSAADVLTATYQGARKIVVTAAGAADTVWTFTHKGRSVKYTVINGDSAAVVATALLALINNRWPGELKASRSSATLRLVVLDRSDQAPSLANSGAGTATNVAGIKYTVVNLDDVTAVAHGLAVEAALHPDLASSTNIAGELHLVSSSDVPGALPTFAVTGGIVIGAASAVSASDTKGWGTQTIRES
jgi:phage tail sheath gpL-like